MNLLKFLFSKTFIKQILLAVIITLLLVFGLNTWLGNITKHDEFRKVPNLSGKTKAETQALLEENDLQVGTIEYLDYNPKYPKGTVIEQNPSADIQVKPGRKIYIKINKDKYRIVKVPDLVHKTKRQAISTLEAIGFRIGKVTYKPYFAKDAVLELSHKGTKIEGTTRLSLDSKIDLVLGDGKTAYQEESQEDENQENNDNTNN